MKKGSLVGSKYAVHRPLKLSSRNKLFKCICTILDFFLLFHEIMNFVVRGSAITSLQEKDFEISDIATTLGKL